MVDRIMINPFVAFYGATIIDLPIWSSTDQLLLNNIRKIRSLMPGKQLLAVLSLDGDSNIFVNRAPSWEEIEWQVMAICGANYQGLLWRGGTNDEELAKRVQTLSEEILTRAPTLAAAHPVTWVQCSGGVPISALRTESKLFVTLLNPQFMNVHVLNQQYNVEVPVEIRRQTGRISLSPPRGLAVEGGGNLAGRTVVVRRDDEIFQCEFSFRSGGEMFIFDLWRGQRRSKK